MKLNRIIRGFLIYTFLIASIVYLSSQGAAYALSPPSLTSPANGSKVNGTVIPFRWAQVVDANNYYVQVSWNSNFTSLAYSGWVGNTLGLNLSGLPDNGQVFVWRVLASNALGQSSYSPIWSVVNGPSALPAIPAQISPANGSKVNGTAIAFSWGVAARANNYYFQLAWDAGFTQIAYQGWRGNSLGVTITGLPDNGQVLYWRVLASNALGQSTYSSIWSVVNGPSALPAIPAQISPANGSNVNGTVIQLRWNVAARADNYYVQVARDSGFTDFYYNKWIGKGFLGLDLTGLPNNGQLYYWRVLAGNALGQSAYSPTWNVTNGLAILRQLQVSRYTTSALTDANANSILTDSSVILNTNDGIGDIACSISFSLSGNVTTFTTGTGVIENGTDFNTVIGLPGHVKVVNHIKWCGGFAPPGHMFGGCASPPGNSFVVVRATYEGTIWAHEYGHIKGLPHRDGDINAVMYSQNVGGRRINSSECTAYRN